MNVKNLHPYKKALFAAAFLAGLILGWIYHMVTFDKGTPVPTLVATQYIEKDQRLMPDMFETKVMNSKHLPGNRIPVENTNYYLGQKAKYPIAVGEVLQQHAFDRNE